MLVTTLMTVVGCNLVACGGTRPQTGPAWGISDVACVPPGVCVCGGQGRVN
jgi:hypothetical protein